MDLFGGKATMSQSSIELHNSDECYVKKERHRSCENEFFTKPAINSKKKKKKISYYRITKIIDSRHKPEANVRANMKLLNINNWPVNLVPTQAIENLDRTLTSSAETNTSVIRDRHNLKSG